MVTHAKVKKTNNWIINVALIFTTSFLLIRTIETTDALDNAACGLVILKKQHPSSDAQLY